MIKIILLVLVIVLCAFFPRVEGFMINDFYSRYMNDIAVPAQFYSQPYYATGFTKVELRDQFFEDALTENLDVAHSPLIYMDEITKYPEFLVLKCEEVLSKILNAKLPSSDTALFAVVKSNVISVKKRNDIYMVESQHVVHRDGKIYGAGIYMTTLHIDGKVYLKKYKLLGFIFEDRIGSEEPYNMDTSKEQPFMMDSLITKDKKYENDYLCTLYTDLEKYKGIKIDHDLNCDDQSYPS